jgi:hypothetical protein
MPCMYTYNVVGYSKQVLNKIRNNIACLACTQDDEFLISLPSFYPDSHCLKQSTNLDASARPITDVLWKYSRDIRLEYYI